MDLDSKAASRGYRKTARPVGARHLEFDTPYSEAPTEAKRKLLNILIQEIRSSVKKGEKKGEIVYA